MDESQEKIHMFTKDGYHVRSFPSVHECAAHFKATDQEVVRSVNLGLPFRNQFLLSRKESRPEPAHVPKARVAQPRAAKRKPAMSMAKIPAGTLLESKIIDEFKKHDRRMSVVMLYDAINPSIPVEIFRMLVVRMSMEGKLAKSGKWYWLEGKPRHVQDGITHDVSDVSIDDAALSAMKAINQEIQRAMTMVASLVRKRDAMIDAMVDSISEARSRHDANANRALELMDSSEWRAADLMAELGIKAEKDYNLPRDMYERGQVARRSFIKPDGKTAIRYATEGWYRRNGVTNYVTIQRLLEQSMA